MEREAGLPLGAHLVTPRGIYAHHGIYVGGDRVIHYTGWADGLQAGPVACTTLKDFKAGRATLYIQQCVGACFSPDEIARRAVSRLGEERYSVLFKNCEHFANWCVCGLSHSDQVDDALELGRWALEATSSKVPGPSLPQEPPGRRGPCKPAEPIVSLPMLPGGVSSFGTDTSEGGLMAAAAALVAVVLGALRQQLTRT